MNAHTHASHAQLSCYCFVSFFAGEQGTAQSKHSKQNQTQNLQRLTVASNITETRYC